MDRKITAIIISTLLLSGIQAQTDSRNQYDAMLRQQHLLSGLTNPAAVAENKTSLIFNEPCGHRYYNPWAIHPTSQHAFEEKLSPLIKAYRERSTIRRQESIKIPIVVHVIHQGQAIGVGENISDDQVQSQIRALNDAFNRTPGTRYAATENNAGLNYGQLTRTLDIEFVLATVDPQGNPTDGINRVETIKDYQFDGDFIPNIIKPATIWDPNYYLNLWSVRLTDGYRPGLLGYAVFPTLSGLEGLNFGAGVGNQDGIVCDFRTVGSNAYDQEFPLNPSYQFGVTTIHEVGHFLGLRHIWGDGESEDVGCEVDDYVEDTPNAAWRSSGCGSIESCTSIDLNENYMDYGSDICKNLFTNGQGDRVMAVLQNSPRRSTLTTSPVLTGQAPPEASRPENNLCIDAIAIQCGQSVSGSTMNSTVEGAYTGLDGRLCSSTPATQGVWYTFTGDGSEVTLDTDGSATSFDASLHVFSGPCDDLICVGGNDDGSSQFANSGSEIIFLAEEGTQYFVYVSGNQGETGEFTLKITCRGVNLSGALANDLYINAQAITCGSTIDGSTDGSSIDAIVSGSCNVDLRDIGVWYRYIGTDEAVTVSTCTNISFDTKIAIFEGFDSFWGCFAENDNGGQCDGGSTKKFFGELGKEYLIWIGGEEEGDFTLTLSCEPAPEAPINIVFAKQQEIDSFPLKYPATKEILGDVIISHEINNKSTIIHNLQPLEQLETIGGDLVIQGNIWDAFNNLDGLQNIQFVGGDLIIDDNAALRSLVGLSSLKIIGGSLNISGFSIESFAGLENLESVTGDFTIDGRRINRGNVRNFEPFDQLTSVGGDFLLTGYVTLDTLTGFNGLKNIGGAILIEDMYSILNQSGLLFLDGFNNLINIGTDIIQFKANHDLQAITGFNKIDSLISIDILDHGYVRDSIGHGFQISGFESLSSLDSILFKRNTKITSFGIFPAISISGAQLIVEMADLIETISGFDNFGFTLEGCPVLSQINQVTHVSQLELKNTSSFEFDQSISVEGDLNISYFNFDEGSLSGFNSIPHIAGDLNIYSSLSSISDIPGFSNLVSIGGNFAYSEIAPQVLLNSISGFGKLDSIGGSMNFRGSIGRIPGFMDIDNIRYITDSLILNSVLENSSIVDLMPHLEYVGKSIIMNGNLGVTSLDLFPELERIDEDFVLQQFNQSIAITGCENLVEIGGSLQIFENIFTDSIRGFNKLHKVGHDLFLSGGLEHVEAFENLDSIKGSLILDVQGFDFETLDFPLLKYVQDLWFYERSRINKFSAPLLSDINNDFRIGAFNFELDTFELPSLESIGGNFVFDSSSITRLIGLENLKTIGGDLFPSTSLFSFGNTQIQSIGGRFVLDTMRFLRNLDDLVSLQSIGGDLWINNNPELSNLDGLSNLQSIGGDIIVSDNPVLDACMGLCNVLVGEGVNGTIALQGNLVGCNDVEELALQCAPTSNEWLPDDVIRVYPNPFDIDVFIESAGIPITSIELLDLMGRRMFYIDQLSVIDFKLPTSDLLLHGVYILNVQTANQNVSVYRLIKQ